MAEIGLVASIVGIVAAGAKLTSSLYAFYGTVSDADDSIRAIATDVSLTTSVLQELSRNIEEDAKFHIRSDNATRTAERAVEECSIVFKNINATLQKALKPKEGDTIPSEAQHIIVKTKHRLRWAFLQPKMELLRSNLDRLKATLMLMLQVLVYAGKLSAEYEPYQLALP